MKILSGTTASVQPRSRHFFSAGPASRASGKWLASGKKFILSYFAGISLAPRARKERMGVMNEMNTPDLPVDEIEIVEETERSAIQVVAEGHRAVKDVREEHRRQAEAVLHNRHESDKALANSEEILSEIDRKARFREMRLGGQHFVGNLPGNVIGQQDDRNRAITYDEGVVHSDASAELQEGLQRHETAHTREEVEAGESSETPEQVFMQCRVEVAKALRARGFDQEVPEDVLTSSFFAQVEESKEWQLGRVAYRERHAVTEGEGVANTSAKYREDYIEPTSRVAQRLGSDGERLVGNAGLRQDGYRTVRAQLLGISIAEEMESRVVYSN